MGSEITSNMRENNSNVNCQLTLQSGIVLLMWCLFPYSHNILSCFEYVYEKEGLTCMDVYIHVDSVLKSDSFTNFS